MMYDSKSKLQRAAQGRLMSRDAGGLAQVYFVTAKFRVQTQAFLILTLSIDRGIKNTTSTLPSSRTTKVHRIRK
jgi:hypothetical protein